MTAGDGNVAPRSGRRRLVIATAGVVAVAAVAFGIHTTQGPEARPRDAPRFVVEDLRDPSETLRLEDFTGRPVVLNFWASWCTPCLREMPALQAAHQQHQPQVAFLGINHEDDRSSALKVLRNAGVTYPSGFDPGGKIAIGYRLFGMPTTVFITAGGRVAAQHTGELSQAELDEAIREHFEPQEAVPSESALVDLRGRRSR